MPEEGVWINPAGKKVFIPLENNPEVFNALIHDLGVSTKLSFHDVYSIDEPDLLAMVPRPVHALIFIAPSPMYWSVRKDDGIAAAADEDNDLHNFPLTYDKSGDDEPVMWFKQTIGNACGLIALLHSVASGEPRKFVTDGSALDRLLKETAPLKPNARADVLYNSEALEKAHMKAARTGDSSAPGADEGVGYHFLAFTRGKDNHMWELEGSFCDGPIDRGVLPEGADLLSKEALDQGIRRFLKHANGTLEFSIIALSESSD
jgi:ubiquitin carboxyl-terminal hydrolase L3